VSVETDIGKRVSTKEQKRSWTRSKMLLKIFRNDKKILAGESLTKDEMTLLTRKQWRNQGLENDVNI